MPSFGPGSASFALVAWTQRARHGRWAFWERGTGETMMQHHCRGKEDSEPVDRHSHHGRNVYRCRGCKAAPRRGIKERYFDRKAWASRSRR
jgi:hypothetical protein